MHRKLSPLALGLLLNAACLPSQAESVAESMQPVTVKTFRIAGSRAFSEAELLKLVEPSVGGAFTQNQLLELADRITAFYRQHGFPRARAILPEQSFAHGVVRFLVTTAPISSAAAQPARATMVRATGFRIVGSRAFTEAELLTLISDAIGKELTPNDLDALAQRITGHYRQKGFRRARAVVQPNVFENSASQIVEGIVRFLITTLPGGDESLRPAPSEAPPLLPPDDLSGGDPLLILLERAKWWNAHDRADLSQEALDKLFNIAPDYPAGLAMKAELEIRRNQPEQARATLATLKRSQPDHPAIARVETLLRIIGPDKAELRKARSMVKAGEYQTAVALFDKLFPGGPPTDELTLEYWKIVADTPNGWYRARDGLRKLARNNPDNPRYQLALAEHETSRLPLNRKALQTIIEMTTIPAYSQQARQAWRNAMLELGDSPSSLPLLRKYMVAEPNDSAVREKHVQIVQAQERHRRLMADPNYRTGIEGLALLDKGELDAAEPLLEQAVRARPKEADFVGGMGMLNLRKGEHERAQSYFTQASRLTQDDGDKWRSLAKVAKFWQHMREAREARKAGNLDLAEARLNIALRMEPAEPNAISALADIQADRGLSGEAAATYRRALAIEPLNGSALDGLLALYRRQGTTQAQHFISQLTPAQHNELRGAISRLDIATLEEQADDTDTLLASMERIPAERRTPEISVVWGEQLERLTDQHAREGRRDEAMRLLREAETIADENDEEANLAIASAWGRLKEYAQADRIFDRLRTTHTPSSTRWHLRYAHYLAMQDSPKLAGELDTIAARPSLTTDEKAELYTLQETFAIRTADTQLAANRPELAHQTLAPLLKTSPDSIPLLLADARAYQAEEQWSAAQAAYTHVLRIDPYENAAQRGMVETHMAAGDRTAALAQLNQWSAAGISSNPYNNMKQIDFYLDLDESERAHELLTPLLAQYPNDSGVLNRASELAQYDGRLDEQIVYLQKALAAEQSERVSALPPGQASVASKPYQEYGFDELGSPHKINRPWEEKKLAELIDRRSPWFSSAIDIRSNSSGTPGLSKSLITEIPLEYKRAWHSDDEVFFRADIIKIDVGNVDPTRTDFGKMFLCQPNCAPGLLAQNAQGMGFTLGYMRDDLRADIGITPLNFPVSNIVGGITYKGDLGDYGYSLGLSRRPINSSLLAFAGTRDPHSGEVWGGVVSTGANLGLSHFTGGAFGFWSSLGMHQLTGRNVQQNSRFQIMAGGQWRLINEENRLFSLGLSGRYTRHAKNVGEYSFGHGGYYSPQSSRSVSASTAYGERYPRFSYVLRGSVSASQSQTQSALYFPTDPVLQQQAEAAAIGPIYSGGSSAPSRGYSLEGVWEYQVDQQLFIGGALSMDRAESYSPNRALFYLRYSLDHAAAQPVFFPPEPVIPSSDF